MNRLLKIVLSILLFTNLNACDSNTSNSNQTKVGIIVPIEHAAMTEIVEGFKSTLQGLQKNSIKIKVSNAQGDPNLQRAIIQQMRDENFSLIVPIGTNTSQMTVAMVKQQPVLSLAAKITDEERKNNKPCNIAVVDDEISPTKSVVFLHTVYPNIKQIVLIHSTSEKVYPEVQAAVDFARQNNLMIKPLMVSTLPDLFTVANAIPPQTQAIFILKDNLIVSGIGTLVKIANDRNIPLITSDQSSVQNGATLALGVHEKQIGIEGAKLADQILRGKSACSLPITEMAHLTVFVNRNALTKSGVDVKTIEAAAKQLNYTVE